MTDDADRREGGAWIGQHPDENTEELRREAPRRRGTRGRHQQRVRRHDRRRRVAGETTATDRRPATTTSAMPERTDDRSASARAEKATTRRSTSPAPPDEGKAFDPEMTEADEANIPPESDADPEGVPGDGGG